MLNLYHTTKMLRKIPVDLYIIYALNSEGSSASSSYPLPIYLLSTRTTQRVSLR